MLQRLRNIFFPPADRSFLRRYGPITLALVVPIAILIAIPPAWEYSNSPEFCGETCHTMPPEYNTYLVSPHARVLCVDCHLGRDSVFVLAWRKSAHMELLYKTVTGDFDYPIRTHSMRPASDTCERCHYPQKFSDDSLRQLARYDDSEANQRSDIYLLMHTGGGGAREGLGRGIHWHIENKIEYITTDPEHQDIPWVRVTYPDGTVDDYTALDSEIDTADLADYDKHRMDCISCHNRISHLIPPPHDLVDSALARGDLSTDIPFIRAQAVDVLAATYEDTDEALTAIRAVETYYSENYPDYYDENTGQITNAIVLIEGLYKDYTYVEQKLSWETHPNNIGHRDSPGCFRCHDGQHFNEAGEVVRLECNLCHSIPQVVEPGVIEPALPLTTGLEPSSHLDSTWISRHHLEFNSTCQSCHTTANPGGITNESFCSNSGCHGVNWEYAGFNAPALAKQLGYDQGPSDAEDTLPVIVEGEELTYQAFQPLFERECSICHGEAPSKGLTLIDYSRLMAGSEDGPVVVPGEPENSKILAVLEAGHFGKFTTNQIALLEQWIVEGALEGKVAEPEVEDTADDTETAEDTASASAEAVTYADLETILVETCGGCHGAGAMIGLNVTTFDTLMAGGDNGPVVESGDPDNSSIVAVQEAGHYGQLDDDQLALLIQWIADGALETAAAPEDAEPDATASASAEAVTYADLETILVETCGGCHGAGAMIGLNVTTFDTLMAGGDNGPVVESGDPDNSSIVAVQEAGHYGQLDDDQLALLIQWIADGALAE